MPQTEPESESESASHATAIAWAVNVGGPAYQGVDGTRYDAETSISGGERGELDSVLGSQDEFLYLTYREGDIRIAHPLEDGRYDITLHFAEPDEIEGGERIFDVLIEGRRVTDGLDVMLSRDGKIRSALTVTIPAVEVSGGTLDIRFAESVGKPVLSALLVQRHDESVERGELVWSDEFDVDGPPDPDKWNIDVWPARVVNDEDQTYTDRPENLRIADGRLVIEARKEKLANAEYTSARIHTRGKHDILYGRIEVRARLPRGMGTWPAIWMLPSSPFKYATKCGPGDVWQGSSTCDAWPNSGEIDILEHVGYEMDHVHGTVHTQAYYWARWNQRKGRILLDGVADDWHVYALEWTPAEIRIYADDVHYFTYVNEDSGWEAWPFDHPFHLIINVAVGGMWGRAGGGIDDDIFPQTLEVDYVRVYRLPDGA